MTSTLKTEKIQFRGDNSEVILLGSEKMGIGPEAPIVCPAPTPKATKKKSTKKKSTSPLSD